MEAFELELDPSGKLLLIRPGQDAVSDVRIRRAFPWSQPDRYISIRDSEGKEILLIDKLSDLSQTQQAIVRETLARWTLIPRIQHIELIENQFGFQRWLVETDRGPADFRVQEREDVRFLGDGRFSIKDADGNIYELPRLDELDEHSVRQAEALL